MSMHQLKDRRPAGSLDDYLREIRDDSLLTPAEEATLAHAVRQGDPDARARLIRANLRLVVKIARDFEGRGLGLEDLVGEGNLGLIRAVQEFDPRFGTRFSTYASHWIKQAIRHALITTTATIRLPAHMVGLLTKYRRAERALLRAHGCPPNREQVIMALDLSPSQRVMVEQALQALRLLPGGGASDDNPLALEETPDPRENAQTPLEAADERKSLDRRLERLDARERTILELRFGLEGQTPLTLKEVGRRLGVTREWVRKIEVRAVRKLDDSWKPAPPSASSRGSSRRRPPRTATLAN